MTRLIIVVSLFAGLILINLLLDRNSLLLDALVGLIIVLMAVMRLWPESTPPKGKDPHHPEPANNQDNPPKT